MLRAPDAYQQGMEEIGRAVEYHESYAELNASTLESLGNRLSQPISAVPAFLPSWAKRCREFGGGKGWAPDWYIVVGGRTGLGKSVVGGNALHHALMSSVSVCLHSTEMEWDSNSVRALSIITGTEMWRLEPGASFSREHFDRATQTLQDICDSTGAKYISNKRRRRKLKDVTDGILCAWEVGGAQFHVVDYMQLISTGSGGYYSEDVNARMAEISDGVMRVTEDNHLVTMALSQLNREGIKADRRPEPYMLHGGSALENDARQVMLMDHTRIYDTADRDGGWNGWMILAKNRHGPAGVSCDIPIHVSRRTLRIRERMDDEVALGEKIEPNRPKPR